MKLSFASVIDPSSSIHRGVKKKSSASVRETGATAFYPSQSQDRGFFVLLRSGKKTGRGNKIQTESPGRLCFRAV